MDGRSRREFLASVGGAMVLAPIVPTVTAAADEAARNQSNGRPARPCRVRTITAGVLLQSVNDLQAIERAVAMLLRAKKAFEDEGYEVQTLRVATEPLLAVFDAAARRDTLEAIRAIDRAVQAQSILVSLGPVLTADDPDSDLVRWAAEVVAATTATSVSMVVASPASGIHARAARAAAETILAISRATSGGAGNFRFAAAANVPAGTPFFPVAWHAGEDSLAIGLESAGLVHDAFAGARSPDAATTRLREIMEGALAPVGRIATAVAERERRRYLGIDPSPAPSKDRSIGRAIEAFTHAPFGSATTLHACAMITDVLKSLTVRTCGYAGLMLPVLEDPMLAQRASEGRYSVRELLLYSSVCGTGLDVVPIPGDCPVESLAGIITDVAALSVKLRKPLSARLFAVPGRKAGETARFDNPLLTDCAVFKAE